MKRSLKNRFLYNQISSFVGKTEIKRNKKVQYVEVSSMSVFDKNAQVIATIDEDGKVMEIKWSRFNPMALLVEMGAEQLLHYTKEKGVLNGKYRINASFFKK